MKTVIFLLVLVLVLVAWSIYSQYNRTLPGQPVWNRVWHAVVAAIGAALALVAAIMQHYGTGTN